MRGLRVICIDEDLGTRGKNKQIIQMIRIDVLSCSYSTGDRSTIMIVRIIPRCQTIFVFVFVWSHPGRCYGFGGLVCNGVARLIFIC